MKKLDQIAGVILASLILGPLVFAAYVVALPMGLAMTGVLVAGLFRGKQA